MAPPSLALAALATIAILAIAGAAAMFPAAEEPLAPAAAPGEPLQRAALGPMGASSSAFEAGGDIPGKHTCQGDNVSPPLRVEGIPPDARSVALIMDDSDVPSGLLPLRTVTHWILWDASIAADGSVVFPEDGAPEGAVEGQHVGGENGYTGPCPPIPLDPHTYVFTFFAVDALMGLEEGSTRAQLETALQGHVMETAVLTGEYARQPLT